MALLQISEPGQSPDPHQRHIAGEDEHVAEGFLQERLAHPGRMTRAERFGLLDELNALVA